MPQVLLLALLLGPQENDVSFGLLSGCSVGFGRQGISVELFVRAALATVTILFVLSSPGGHAVR